MDLSQLQEIHKVSIISGVMFIVNYAIGLLIQKSDATGENDIISPVIDRFIISLEISLTFFLWYFYPEKWWLWIMLNFLLWVVLTPISANVKHNKEKRSGSEDFERDKSKTAKKDKGKTAEKELYKELEDYRTIKKRFKKRKQYLENELNDAVNYIVNDSKKIISNDSYDNSILNLLNKMYQEGLQNGQTKDQIIEEIDDFFHKSRKLRESITRRMHRRFEAVIEKIRESSYDEFSYEDEFHEENVKRPSIPQSIKDKVWNRDGGKCVQCGSNENIEFDHIIPFSKGGSSTYRNLQILCEKCNRSKSDKIG